MVALTISSLVISLACNHVQECFPHTMTLAIAFEVILKFPDYNDIIYTLLFNALESVYLWITSGLIGCTRCTY